MQVAFGTYVSVFAVQSKLQFTRQQVIMINHLSVDQAGSERTEAGESALPAEESPQPGRAKRKL